MDFGKLSSQLVAEAKKSPAKASVLGVLALVALYFWTPLVWGWLRPSEETLPEETAAVTTSESPAPVASVPSETPLAVVRQDWQTTLRMMHDDARTRSATLSLATRNPFVPPSGRIAARVAPIVENDPATKSVTPEQLGFELTSTWVGARLRTATIGGIALPEGSLLVASQSGELRRVKADEVDALELESGDIAFRVVEVQAKHAILERGGERYLLQLKRGATPGDKKVRLSAAKEQDL